MAVSPDVLGELTGPLIDAAQRTVLFWDVQALAQDRSAMLVVPMIRQVKQGITKPFSFSGMQKIVHTMRDKIGLPSTFTLDACRHGGMTELEEAQLTDGQGRALSAHKSQQAYEGYAKRTMERALSATRKRYAHRLANAAGTNIQNELRNDIQNADVAKNKISTK
jgi:hypothetical protein